jgi:hypothetical protein
MNGNRGNDAIGICIDHRNRPGLTVGDVDLVSNGINSQSDGIGAYLQSSVLAQIDEIENCDCIRAVVADVCELPVAVGDVREAASAAAGYADEERGCSNSAAKKKTVVRGGHCWEFISEFIWSLFRRHERGKT